MSGEQYISSLPPERRPVAREWSEMPAPEFQARIAVSLMDINDRIDQMTKPWWKAAAQAFGVAGAAALSTLAAMVGTGSVRP